MKKALRPTPESETEDLLPQELLRVEKELVLYGFFTPKNKTNRRAREKVIRFTRENPEGGKPLGVEIRIIAGGTYGLPTVADQDKWLALQSIIRKKLLGGESINPVAFRSSEIL